MTVRDSDVEYDFDDPDEGWFGMAQPAQPVEAGPARPAVEPAQGPEHPEDVADTDRWFVHDLDLAAPVEPDDHPVAESVAASLNVVPTRRNGFVKAAAPMSWESRLSNSGAWDFKATSKGSRFPKRAVVVAVGIIVGGAVACGVFLSLRSPAPAAEESPTAPPSQSAAPPAPTTSAPAPVANVPLPPPPSGPPPPPPPSAEELSPPVVTRQYTPSYQIPDETKKPQTNVTRVPMSATPPPPPRNTDKGRATPGDSGTHGFFG